MRRVRKIVTYACTACYQLFPTAKAAKEHASTHPRAKKTARAGARRPTQVGLVLQAVRAGADTAAAVSRRTKLPLSRVHSLLAYHRRRGAIQGGTGKLRAG